MSSDLSEFEGYFLTNPFSPLSDSSSIDIFKPFQENNFNLNPLSPTLTHNILDIPFTEIDQITPTTTLLSSSPPSHHLESLSLHQMGNSVNSLDVCPIDVKAEENQLPFYDYYVNNNSLMSHSYEGCDNRLKMMQRSYSSKSFDGRPNGFVFQPKFDSLIESSNNDPHMRRVCSTGDLQSLKSNQTRQTLSSSPLATEGSLEEANFKVSRYSPEERNEKILRYKAKRTQRNFNKTIKYACRKTLADNRPRIRGRFVRNDESGETPKTINFQQYEDEDELWMKMDGLQKDCDDGISIGPVFDTYMPTTQFHQFTYVSK